VKIKINAFIIHSNKKMEEGEKEDEEEEENEDGEEKIMISLFFHLV
jgi:hypothetical protein